MVEKKSAIGQDGLYLTRDVESGYEILDLTPNGMVNTSEIFQNKYTVRLWDDKTCKQYHVLSDMGQFLNHSCNPNCVFKGFKLIAIKNMTKGTQVNFDYRTTERMISEPFDCLCKSDNCAKRIE